MKKVIFKGLAGSINSTKGSFCVELDPSSDFIRISNLDGIKCEDDFAEYSDLQGLLESGYMKFIFENGRLYVIVEYSVKETLSEDQIEELKNETQGQLSDGIGEGFEQFPCTSIDGIEIYISPWFPEQVLETIIE